MRGFLNAENHKAKKEDLRAFKLSAVFCEKTQRSLRLFIFQCILLQLLLLSCKKYEDGPLISFRSLTERLSNHWKPEKKFINEQETTLTDEEQRTVYTFDKSGVFIKRIPNGPYYTSYHGTWEFTDKKEKIKTLLTYIQFGNPVTEELEYKILRLKEKELRLIYTDSANDEIEIHFIPE